MTLLLSLVTRTYTHRWQGIRLSCLFLLFASQMPVGAHDLDFWCNGLRGIALIALAGVFLFHTCVFHLFFFFCFWLTTPPSIICSPSSSSSSSSFFFFFVFGICLSMCCNAVGTEEICHVITPHRPHRTRLSSSALGWTSADRFERRLAEHLKDWKKKTFFPSYWCSWLLAVQ